MERARADGFYLEVGEVTEGTYCLAAPVSSPSSDLIGAVGVVGPTLHLDQDLEAGLAEDVVRSARSICEEIGGEVPISSGVGRP